MRRHSPRLDRFADRLSGAVAPGARRAAADPAPDGSSPPAASSRCSSDASSSPASCCSMYYVPAPSLAYDSVRFIMQDLPYGWLVRGLHFWGASFLVVPRRFTCCACSSRGSYKAPREVTWLTGLVLLMLILGFSLSGYLLPWDQKAYWATTVTINVARGTPLVGEQIANVLRGGPDLGALTLGRWFSAHVFLLPAALVTFIVAHICLDAAARHLGPDRRRRPGAGIAFYPWHVIKDTVMMAAVFASLVTVATIFPGAPRRDRQSRRRQLRPASRVVFPVAVPAAEVLPGSARAGGDDGDSGRRVWFPVPAAVPRSPRAAASLHARPPAVHVRHARDRASAWSR